MNALRTFLLATAVGALSSPAGTFAEGSLAHKHAGGATLARAPKIEAHKPEFLVRAEKNYRDAQAAVGDEQLILQQMHQEEAQLRRRSMARTGSWIEPADLWRKKLAQEKAIAFRQELERKAHEELEKARNQARALVEKEWAKSHKPSWFSWWWH
jgi:hypothetical protein